MANPGHEARLAEALRTGKTSIDLSGCDLSGIQFPSIRLQDANLSGADLSGADLSGAYLTNANLEEARLCKTRITYGDFRNANLVRADLRSADLNSSVLTGAKIKSANLARAKLVKVRLDDADLTGADLNLTDLRGAKGLTAEQPNAAKNSLKAILDEYMLSQLGRKSDPIIARHGRSQATRDKTLRVDFLFTGPRPLFGDVHLLCGSAHPKFPPTQELGFSALAALGIQQVDDYFAVCVDGDPAIWIFPLVNGRVVDHHPGPFDGLRLELADASRKKLWKNCVAEFTEKLQLK